MLRHCGRWWFAVLCVHKITISSWGCVYASKFSIKIVTQQQRTILKCVDKDSKWLGKLRVSTEYDYGLEKIDCEIVQSKQGEFY